MENNRTLLITSLLAIIILLFSGACSSKNSEVKSLKVELDKATNENTVLHNALGTLKDQFTLTKQQLKAQETAIARIGELEHNNKNMQKELSKLKGMLSFTRIQLEANEKDRALVVSLEKENKELRAIFKKINAITNTQNTKTLTTPVP